MRALVAGFERVDLLQRLDAIGLSFAPIARPSDLFDDPHLVHGEGLVEVTLADGTTTRLPNLPIEIDGARMPLLHVLPSVGADQLEVLREAGGLRG